MRSALIVLIVLVGLAMATEYTPWQDGATQGLKIGFRLGAMYNQAQQGYNISGFNKEVDIYNAWIQKNFGNNSSLLMQKIPMPGYPTPTTYNKPIHAIDESFNESRRILESAAVSNEGRIMDMPAGAYYTWNPNALQGQPTITDNRIYGGLS